MNKKNEVLFFIKKHKGTCVNNDTFVKTFLYKNL